MIKMTIIELFDENQMENVVSVLSLKPEKVVFVGFDSVMTSDRKKDIEKFFKIKGIKLQIEYAIVESDDYQNILNTLERVFKANEDCIFDLTGGSEMVIMAMGELSSQNDVPVVQFDIENKKVVKVRKPEAIGECSRTASKISEHFTLMGGLKVSNDVWSFSEDFKADIKRIWEACKIGHYVWNKMTPLFANIDEGGEVVIDTKEKKQEEILEALSEKGILRNFSNKNGIVRFTYKNSQIAKCLTKAGNILELYAYVSALEINERQMGYFSDIDIGVMADWDGVLLDWRQRTKDTKNEIDLVFMRGAIPVFVSCKNGEVTKEALYELETISRHLGGKYVTKVLLASYDLDLTSNRKYVAQRAKDMGIKVVCGIDKMGHEKFLSELMLAAK